MTTLEALVGGETFNLSDRLVRSHLGNDGFGLPPVSRKTERGPFQHGTTLKGMRLEPRTIQLVLLAYGASEDDYYQRRDELAYIFSPSDDPIKLRFTLPSGAVRQIDCTYNGGLTLPSTDRYGHSQKVALSLVADDPTWYDPDGVTVSFGISAGGSSFNVPLAVSINVGSSVLDQSVAVTYGGSWDAYPIVTIYGPIANPVITNTTTGDTLDFTGHTIGAGDFYTVDTRYGSKRVYRNGNLADNRISELTTASNLATFRVYRKRVVPGGVNTFRVTGTGANTTTQVYLAYNPRFLSV